MQIKFQLHNSLTFSVGNFLNVSPRPMSYDKRECPKDDSKNKKITFKIGANAKTFIAQQVGAGMHINKPVSSACKFQLNKCPNQHLLKYISEGRR